MLYLSGIKNKVNMKRLQQGEVAYIKSTGEKITITIVDNTVKPFRYWFVTKKGNLVYCTRDELFLKKQIKI